MKRRSHKQSLLAVLIVLSGLMTVPAYAQFSVGARAGANLATEPVNGFYHVFLARPYVGLFGQYNFSPAFGVQLGANYSGEGANYKDLGNGDIYHIRHSFLTIPLLVQYKFGFGAYIEAGPQLGLLLSSSAKYNDEAKQDTKDYYKGSDVSAGVGVGYDFKGSLQGLGLSVRYMRGLTSFNKLAVDENNDGIKSRVLSIGITYKYAVKKK